MEFRVKNLRTGEVNNFNSDEMRNYVIRVTRSTYEQSRVLAERTGLRPQYLSHTIKNNLNGNYILFEKTFIVTALSRINNDKYSRYLLIIDGSQYVNNELIKLVEDYVPIIVVDIQAAEGEAANNEAGNLSIWFRSNMGRAFSFIDIDYLILNPTNSKVLLIEEKDNINAKIGYGQLLSYGELLNDIIRVPNPRLIFSYYSNNNTIRTFECNNIMLQKSNFDTYFISEYHGFYLKNQYISQFDNTTFSTRLLYLLN